MIPEAWTEPIASAAALAVLWTVESAAPMFENSGKRLGHDVGNLALGVFNAGVTSILFASATLAVTETAGTAGFGLLNLSYVEGLPSWVGFVLAILVFDAWQYVWHRLNHRLPFLWRFHAVHHSDAAMDATTGLRFHTGEIVLSSIARLAVLPVLGLSITHLLVYETILLPIIFLHHSNVRMPAGIDRVLRAVIVTPWMHWVHHSDWQPETDSNYSSIFSWWDRIFGSFRLRRDPSGIRLGLGQPESEWRTVRGVFTMPLRKVTRSGDPPPGSETSSPPDPV